MIAFRGMQQFSAFPVGAGHAREWSLIAGMARVSWGRGWERKTRRRRDGNGVEGGGVGATELSKGRLVG